MPLIVKDCMDVSSVGWTTRVQIYSRRSQARSHPIHFAKLFKTTLRLLFNCCKWHLLSNEGASHLLFNCFDWHFLSKKGGLTGEKNRAEGPSGYTVRGKTLSAETLNRLATC